jgi:hypothetical protein
MTMRFSILIRERLGDGRETELCQCDSNPEALIKALRAKKTTRGRSRFNSIRYVENQKVETNELI